MKHKLLILISACAGLAACATPQELAAIREEQMREDIAQCRAYGWQDGSEGFAQCRMQLDLARKAPRYPAYYAEPLPGYYYSGFGVRR